MSTKEIKLVQNVNGKFTVELDLEDVLNINKGLQLLAKRREINRSSYSKRTGGDHTVRAVDARLVI